MWPGIKACRADAIRNQQRSRPTRRTRMPTRWRTTDSGRPGGSNTSKATKSDDCIFCSKPALGDDERGLIVHRGERCFVMLNAFPYTSGHVMVAPYEHTRATCSDLDEPTAGRADGAHPALAARRSSAPTAPRATTSASTWARSPAPGVADHVHLHVVPRWKGDTNFMPVVGDTRVLPESLADTLARACATAFARRTPR